MNVDLQYYFSFFSFFFFKEFCLCLTHHVQNGDFVILLYSGVDGGPNEISVTDVSDKSWILQDVGVSCFVCSPVLNI